MESPERDRRSANPGQCGVLFFFPTEEAYVHDSIAAHRDLGLSTEVLDQRR